MKYKSITKDEVLSLRFPPGWKSALKDLAYKQDKSLNGMLFELIKSTYQIQINTHLNKDKKVRTYESVEDIPFDPID